MNGQAAWQAGDRPDAVLVSWRLGLDRLTVQAEAQRLGLSASAGEIKLHQALHASIGATLTRSTSSIGLDQVSLVSGGGGAAVDKAIALYQSSPLVAAAEPDPPLHAAAVCPVPNDPLYSGGQQWYLTATAWPQAQQAWCAGTLILSTQVIVAVLDTGVDAHPDLAPQLLPAASFVTGDPGTDDLNGHGTFCAGLIGATPGNGNGMAGAFFDSGKLRLLPVRVLDQCGAGSMGDLAAGIAWAVAQGAHVISMSIQGPSGAVALENAVSLARMQGVLLVAATGNDHTSTAYPAAYSAVLSVSALDHFDALASYSNFGKVDISAPGGDNSTRCDCLAVAAGCAWEVWSLATVHPNCTVTGSINPTCALANGVEASAGTSFAAPLVAAAAALLISQDSTRSVAEVTRRLLQSAKPTALGSGWNQKAGWGKLDYYGALTLENASGPGAVIKAWNWPNPFNPEKDGFTTLTFMLPAQADVELSLYDSAGDRVRRWSLGAAQTNSGMNLLTWDGRNGQGGLAGNGSYLLVVKSGSSRVTNRVAVLH